MARLALATLLAAARLRLAAGAADEVPSHKPGEDGYYTELQVIYSLDGEFDPPFRPDHHKYKVHVNDIHKRKITLKLKVDERRYYQAGYPNLYFDDKLQKDYDPSKELTISRGLDDGIDAVEEEILIKLQDPFQRDGGLSIFQKMPETVYSVTIMQKPEWDLVVRAGIINVTDSTGKEIPANVPFKASSDLNDYEYTIPESACKGEVCSVGVQVRCSSVATGLKMDGDVVSSGDTVQYDMSKAAVKAVMAECYYDNNYWTGGVKQMRFYEILLTRDIEFQGNVSVLMMPNDGVCEKMLDEDKPGFDCRTLVDSPHLVVHSTQASGLTLVSPSGHDDTIRAGIPTRTSVPDEGPLKLNLEWGTDVLTFPIVLRKPALCEELECPDGQALKEPSTHASEHMCQQDTCNVKDDSPYCCGDRATCADFGAAGLSCAEDEAVVHNAAELLCEFTVCKEKDSKLCCAKKAMCSTFSGQCPEGQGIRVDAEHVMCAHDICTSDDNITCCKSTSKPTCDKMPPELCPDGMGPRADGPSVYCQRSEEAWDTSAGGNCREEHGSRCCKPRASCEDFFDKFECPDHATKRDDFKTIMCRGEACLEEYDTKTCCAVQATCEEMPKCVDALTVVRADADQHWCNGTKCDEKVDRDECCVPPASCDQFESRCPEGKALAFRASERLCVEARCTSQDEGQCCVARAKCTGFAGKCPLGTVKWDEGVCEEAQCKSSDTDLCCTPTFAELEGLMRLANVDYYAMDYELMRQVEELVIPAIASQARVDGQDVDVMICSSLSGEGVNVDFEIDVTDLSKEDISAVKERMQHKAAITSKLVEQLNELRGVKKYADREVQVPFVALSEGQVDETHGGMYLSGKATSQEGDLWTIELNVGVTLSGISASLMKLKASMHDEHASFKAGDAVYVLVPLNQVANYQERGQITTDDEGHLVTSDIGAGVGDRKDLTEAGRLRALSGEPSLLFSDGHQAVHNQTFGKRHEQPSPLGLLWAAVTLACTVGVFGLAGLLLCRRKGRQVALGAYQEPGAASAMLPSQA